MKRWKTMSLGLMFLCAQTEAQTTDPACGLWWNSHGDGAPLQMRLYADGTAWSDYPANNPGRWNREGDRLVCKWADDWKEVLVPSSKGWSKLGFKPGAPLQGPASNHSRAYRVTTQPDGWCGVRPRP